MWNQVRQYVTGHVNYYKVLDVPTNALIKEIKMKFKQLSKKYHPDLNNHLEEDEKAANKEKYLEMVTAYDTLKDIKKKKLYDAQLRASGITISHNAKREWNNKYYGEAKYYSKSGGSYTSSGLNTKRHRIRYHNSDHDTARLTFQGDRTDYSNRHDVPHFDYQHHLSKNLKFEQRIINKNLTPGEQQRLLATLLRDGVPVDEETATKYLLRHMRTMQASLSPEKLVERAQSHHIYQRHKPESDQAGWGKYLMLGGASLGLFLIWKLLS